MMRPYWVALLLLALSGCDWIGRQADAAGEYMPVIGNRCEHWQCITSEGQAESNANKTEQQRQQKEQVQQAAPVQPVTSEQPSEVIYPESPPAEAPESLPTPIYPGYPDAVPPPSAPDKVTPPL